MKAKKYVKYYNGQQELANLRLRREVTKYCSENDTPAIVVEPNPYLRTGYIVYFKSQFAEQVVIQHCIGLSHLLSFMANCPYKSLPLFTAEKK